MASMVYQTLQYICTFFIVRRDSSCRKSENMTIGDGCYISTLYSTGKWLFILS